jgi:hypothetical protein
MDFAQAHVLAGKPVSTFPEHALARLRLADSSALRICLSRLVNVAHGSLDFGRAATSALTAAMAAPSHLLICINAWIRAGYEGVVHRPPNREPKEVP